MTTPLHKTKTFWVGVAALLVTLIENIFGEGEIARPLSEILPALLTDPKLFVGLAAIFGRKAILTLQSGG